MCLLPLAVVAACSAVFVRRPEHPPEMCIISPNKGGGGGGKRGQTNSSSGFCKKLPNATCLCWFFFATLSNPCPAYASSPCKERRSVGQLMLCIPPAAFFSISPKFRPLCRETRNPTAYVCSTTGDLLELDEQESPRSGLNICRQEVDISRTRLAGGAPSRPLVEAAPRLRCLMPWVQTPRSLPFRICRRV